MNDDPPKLDYETPDPAEVSADPRWATAAALGLLAVGPIVFGVSLLLEDSDAQLSGLTSLVYGVLAGSGAASAGLYVGGVLIHRRTARLRGIGFGLLIGGGLAFLVFGGCFALTMT